MRGRGGLVALATALALVGPAGPGRAQEAARSPILVVDTDNVLANSTYGAGVEDRFNAAAETLVAENDRIEQQLIAEERALTEERATLPADLFRQRAEAFDQKVTRIRAEQDAKARDVQAIRDTGRDELIRKMTQVLAQIARERGAVIVLERGQVFLSADSIDVTAEVVGRLNSDPGEGATPAEGEAAPN